MTEAVKRALMGLAQEDYMKMVEQRKIQERELKAEVERLKNERKREIARQHNSSPEESEESEIHDSD